MFRSELTHGSKLTHASYFNVFLLFSENVCFFPIFQNRFAKDFFGSFSIRGSVTHEVGVPARWALRRVLAFSTDCFRNYFHYFSTFSLFSTTSGFFWFCVRVSCKHDAVECSPQKEVLSRGSSPVCGRSGKCCSRNAVHALDVCWRSEAADVTPLRESWIFGSRRWKWREKIGAKLHWKRKEHGYNRKEIHMIQTI